MRVSDHPRFNTSFLSITSKIFDAIINKKIVENLNRDNPLSDERYRFQSARSTADIVTVITYKISEALDNRHITRTNTFEKSKAFD